MKTISIFMIFLAGCLVANGQVVVVHSYDAGGNRIYRVQQTDNAPESVKPNPFSTLQNQSASQAVPSRVADTTNKNAVSGTNNGLQTTLPLSSSNKISLYPNPATDFLNINLNEDYMNRANKSLFLYDTKGRILKQIIVEGPNIVIDLSAYPAGTYILKMLASGFTQDFNVVKQ